jgi:hypothetical protein
METDRAYSPGGFAYHQPKLELCHSKKKKKPAMDGGLVTLVVVI